MLQTIPDKAKYLLKNAQHNEDETTLNYTKAQSLYNKHKIIVEFGGNHRFENLDEYLSMIEKFIN